MTGYLTFGDVSTAEYGISVDTSQSFVTPERRVETTQVLGRNGDYILYDPGVFENAVVSYPCFIRSGFEHRFSDFMTRLATLRGLQVLRDSAHPGRYRSAYFMQSVAPQPGAYNVAGVFTLQFSCGVWRLDEGDVAVTFTSNGVLHNPTLATAKPLLYVVGTGNVTIAEQTIQIKTSGTTVDTELREETHPIGGVYPVLQTGNNEIRLASGITRVDITPRWWSL
jgi:phage-related protein